MPEIVAIDDKRDNLIALQALLRIILPDCAVTTAQSGREGIALIHEHPPDVILLDLYMPKLDGFAVCHKLKTNQHTRHIPIIILTAVQTGPQCRVRALNAGADAFLTKPIDEGELAAQVKAMLRIKQAEDRLRNKAEALEALVHARTRELQRELQERQYAEESLRESQKKLETLFEILPIGISILDKQRHIIFQNRELERILKLSPEAFCRKDYTKRTYLRADGTPMPPEEFPSQRAFQEHTAIQNVEIGVRIEDESIIWTHVSAAPLPFDDWRIVIATSDISLQKEAEAQLKTSLREQETLLQEVHHRVKNNMQLISSLLALQAHQIEDANTLQYFKSIRQRIRAMAIVHEKLYHSKNFAHIALHDYICSLTNELIQAYTLSPIPPVITFELEKITLALDKAIPCGLILNELISHALHHAFSTSNHALQLKIGLHERQDRNISISIQDNSIAGGDNREAEMTGQSLGLELMKDLARYQLHGELTINCTDGMTASLNFQP